MMGVFVLGCLVALPGCGGGSGNALISRQRDTILTQTFTGPTPPLAALPLNELIDITRPFKVTVGGTVQVPNVDYRIDTVTLNQLFLTTAVPADVQVAIQYYPLPLETQQFRFGSTSATSYPLTYPADVTKPVTVTVSTTQSTSNDTPVTLSGGISQNYTINASQPTILHLTHALNGPGTLSISYVPQAQ